MRLDLKTPEEIALEKFEHQQELIRRRRFRSLKTQLIKECKEDKGNLRKVELRLEFLTCNLSTPIPYTELTREQTIACFSEAIEEFKESLIIKKEKNGTDTTNIPDLFTNQPG